MTLQRPHRDRQRLDRAASLERDLADVFARHRHRVGCLLDRTVKQIRAAHVAQADGVWAVEIRGQGGVHAGDQPRKMPGGPAAMRRRARIDATASELVKVARTLGAQWLPLPGACIDGLLLHRGRVIMCDWKSPGGSLTVTQERLIKNGWPVRFMATADDVLEVLR